MSAPPPVDLSMDPHAVPPELKKEGPDWFAVFNPHAGKDGKKRALDVGLVHTLMHERYVAVVLRVTREPCGESGRLSVFAGFRSVVQTAAGSRLVCV